MFTLVAYVWPSTNDASISIVPLDPGTVVLLAPGAAIGYLSHLGLDASTRSGIWLLLPKDRKVGLPRKYSVRTGSPTELLISGGMALVRLGLGLTVFAPALGSVKFLFGSGG